MSDFSNIDRLKCKATLFPIIPLFPEIPCDPTGVTELDIWYDPATERYYVKQSRAPEKQPEFLASGLYTQTSSELFLPIISRAGKDRIIEYFSLDVPQDKYNSSVANVEKVTVHEIYLKPVDFLLYFNKKDLEATPKMVEKPELDTIVIDGGKIFPMLEQMLKKIKTYSRYQSLFFTIDKIRILKEDGRPFYLKLVSERLENFINKFKELFRKNKANIKSLGDIIFYIETLNFRKRIVDISVDNEKIYCQNNDLAIGLQEFLKEGFMQDDDLINFVLNVEDFLSDPNVSWIDLIIRYGASLKLDNEYFDAISNIPCFSDFVYGSDAVLDSSLSFFEKIEFSLHKKNSFAFASVLTSINPLKSFSNSINIQNFEDLLDSTFKKLKLDTAQQEVVDMDKIFDLFSDGLEGISFDEDAFEKVNQFLGPRAFKAVLNDLLKSYQKMSDPFEMFELVVDNFVEGLEFDKLMSFLEKLPTNLKFDFLDILKKEKVVEDIEDEELQTDYVAILLDVPIEAIKQFFKEFMKKQDNFEVFTSIPEFNQITKVFDALSIPQVDIINPIELLSGLGKEIDIFTENFLKIPEIPELPSFKFSIVKFIQDNLKFVLRAAIIAIISIVVQKIIGFIKKSSEGGLTDSLPQSVQGDYNIEGGLDEFVGKYLCKDDPENLLETNEAETVDQADATDALLKNTLPSEGISDEKYLKLAEVIGNSSSITDIIDAVIEEDSTVNTVFIEDLTGIIRQEVPEFQDFFKDPKDTKAMFTNIRNYMSPETMQTLRDFKEQYSDTPFAYSYCLKKEEAEQWANDKKTGLMEKGYTGQAAEKYISDRKEEIKEHTADILDFLTNGIEHRLFDDVESILNGDPECPDLYSGIAAQEVIQEQTDKENKASNMMLEKINLTFIEDMTLDTFFSKFNSKGILARIMADKYGRSMSEIKRLKDFPLSSFLIKLGLTPGPEFPETIGVKVTDTLEKPFVYNPTDQTVLFKEARELSFSSFFSDILYTEETVTTKKPDLTIYCPADVDGIDVEYIDYHTDNNDPVKFKYYLKIGQEMLIDSRLRIPEDILESYPQISGVPKTSFINLLLQGEPYSETDYQRDNELVFSNRLMTTLGFYETIDFGYPTEVTKGMLDELYQLYEDTGDINQIIEEIPHIKILEPESYGTLLGKPRLHSSEQEMPEGYFKDSKNFYNKPTSKKLNKTILNLESIKEFISSYTENLDEKEKFAETSPECLSDSPIDKIDDPKKIANAQAMVKTYIRTFLSEHIFLGYNVYKNIGFELDEAAMASYILENIKREIETIKIPSLGLYNEFVTYILMLLTSSEAYSRLYEDEISESLRDMNEDYQPLQDKEIQFIKRSALTKFDTKYESYILGFYGIAFQEKYKFVYDSSIAPLVSLNMTNNEIKFANKIGHGLQNITLLEEAMLRTIEEEIKEYQRIYLPQKSIYKEFLRVLTEEELNFVVDKPLVEEPNSWESSAFYQIKEKDGTEYRISKENLINKLDGFSGDVKLMHISTLFGDATLNQETESYDGTIGIQYGLSLYYGGQEVSVFFEDIKDVPIQELLDDLQENDNFNSKVADHQCYVDNLFQTKESRIIFDLTFQIKKLPTMISLYYIENLIPSIGKGQDEAKLNWTAANPVLAVTSLVVGLLTMGRQAHLVETKKEIKELFLSNYIREFYDPPRGDSKTFFDFKASEFLKEAIDNKNFSLGSLPLVGGDDEAPSLFQRIAFLDDIQVDDKGFPLMNKFLSNFKEEE
jgi:hypothetical protein